MSEQSAPTTTATGPEILDMAGAAAFLTMGYNTFRAMRANRKGPPPSFFVGNRPRWTVEALRSWSKSETAIRETDPRAKRNQR